MEPLDGIWRKRDVWEPQAVASGHKRCTSTPVGKTLDSRRLGGRPGSTKTILASLSAQQEKLRNMESRLRHWPGERTDRPAPGSVASFLEEIAVKIDSLNRRLQDLDDGKSPRRYSNTRWSEIGASRAPSLASEPLTTSAPRPCLGTYPSWPEQAELAWRQLAASWQEMAARAPYGCPVADSVRQTPEPLAPVPRLPQPRGRQESSSRSGGNTSMTESFAAVGRKAPQPRDVSFSYDRVPFERPEEVHPVVPGPDVNTAAARPLVFQGTPTRLSRHPTKLLGSGTSTSMEPMAVKVPPKSSEDFRESIMSEPFAARRPQGLLWGEPAFDPNAHHWAK